MAAATPSLRQGWRRRWRQWVDARAPRRDRITLDQRNVYILPSRGGLGYTVVVLVLLLASVNEQLNLGYALAFLLGGVGLSAMWLTHGNLRGLSLSLGNVSSVHAGQNLAVPVVLDAAALARGRYGLQLRVDGMDAGALPRAAVQGEVGPRHQATVQVPMSAHTRGWMELPRIRIETTYPLGLFRAWAYWRAQRRVLVWPALDLHAPPLPDAAASGKAGAGTAAHVMDPPDSLRAWRRGDTLRQVAWKKSATRLESGLEPVTRQAHGRPKEDCWVDWELATGLATEARLSRLAAWLVLAERQALDAGQPYGLRMPGSTVAPGQGPAHLQRCLDVLAGWGLPS